jgi:hypothetical protein
LRSLPDLEFLRVPDSDRDYRLFYQECNYLQVLEGGIDPTHVMWLHSPYDLSDEELTTQQQPAQHLIANRSGARTPMDIEIADSAGGFTYGARRPAGEGKSLWRVNQFILPFYTMPPGGDQAGASLHPGRRRELCKVANVKWYPSQDIKESSKKRCARHSAEKPTIRRLIRSPSDMFAPRQKSNDYLIDWQIHQTRRFGIAGVNLGRLRYTREGPRRFSTERKNICAQAISGDQSAPHVARGRAMRQAKRNGSRWCA